MISRLNIYDDIRSLKYCINISYAFESAWFLVSSDQIHIIGENYKSKHKKYKYITNKKNKKNITFFLYDPDL
jgi:hypothetical protein